MLCSLVFPVVGLRFLDLMCCCVMHFLIVEAEKCCRFSYVILISHHSRLKSDHCDKVFDALSLHLVLVPTMQQPAFTTDTQPHQCSHQQHSSQVVLMNNPVVDLYFDFPYCPFVHFFYHCMSSGGKSAQFHNCHLPTKSQ